MKRLLVIGFAVLIAGWRVAAASELTPVGQWDRDDGRGGIRIAQCGLMLCGKVIWLRDKGGPAYVGQQVLYDLRRSGSASWEGAAVNPEDGRTYAGRLTFDGLHMVTRGCALGGMICRTVDLTKVR